MKVTCELGIGNDQDHPNTKIVFQGNPMEDSGFIHLIIGDCVYEVRPQEIHEAVDRVRSNNDRQLGNYDA